MRSKYLLYMETMGAELHVHDNYSISDFCAIFQFTIVVQLKITGLYSVLQYKQTISITQTCNTGFIT